MQSQAALERRLEKAVASGEEPASRARERLGEASKPRPDGALVWIHLHGVEDVHKATGLFDRLRTEREDISLLVTSMLTEDLSNICDDLLHQFAPYSGPGPAKAFLDHWKPDVALWMDRQLDTHLLPDMFARHIPTVWLNAHLAKDAPRPRRLRAATTRQLLTGFDRILANDDEAARDIKRLGAPEGKVQVTGALEMQVVPPGCNTEERDQLASVLASRPVWFASCLDEGEDETICAAHRQLVRKSHRLLLIIEPADPARGPALADSLEQDGWTVACRSRNQVPDGEVQIYIADGEAESGLWMHLAPVTFVGGSLNSSAHTNPLKPAALGSVVLYGPKTQNHLQAFNILAQSGAARRVHNADTLAFEVERLLSPERAAKMAMAAWDVTSRGAEVSDLICDFVLSAMDRAGV